MILTGIGGALVIDKNVISGQSGHAGEFSNDVFHYCTYSESTCTYFGGVMKAKDVFFDKMEKCYRNMIHAGMQSVVFKEALLDETGIVGAAMLAKEKSKKKRIG